MVRYSEELIEEVRNSNDIVDIISQYVVLKRSGRNYFGLCPFHKEKSPSFSVSPDKQIFHCFGCGAGGNVFHFISKIENVNFVESMQLLADRAGITLPTLDNSEDSKKQYLKSKVYEINEIAAQFYHENLYKPTSKPAQDYVKKRRLDNKTLKAFQIGYAGRYNELYQELVKRGYKEEEILASSMVLKNDDGKFVDRFRKRFMIPIRDVREKVIAFGGRVLDDSKPKYINSPENIVYSKGRNLFGLNVAKRNPMDKIVIVEGYMDAISLYQRGITNVVASLGTALTEAQGRLLRRYANKIIISYDSDAAGQAATMRGLEILQNLGYDVRILQLDDPNVKDPDEYVLKNGSGRFNLCVDKAISLVEFKVKMLKKSMTTDTTSDKIKFLNEVAKILASVDNNIEKEVYIERISKEYNVSKEAIYAQTNKLQYSNSVGEKILEKPNLVINTHRKNENSEISEAVIKRENMVIAILLTEGIKLYEKFKQVITTDEFKYPVNKEILQKIYDEFEKGNDNINSILDSLQDEEILKQITQIMADDYDIQDMNKAVLDVIKIYEKEKIISRRNKILSLLENTNIINDEKASLEKELSDIIIKLARFK
jgi:DNA primase